MARVFSNISSLRAGKAWGALDLAEVEGATVRLHWTNEPYKWHTNDGAEAFVVLSGKVEMRYKVGGMERIALLGPTDIFLAEEGDEHVAHPMGEARVLVVERKGSI